MQRTTSVILATTVAAIVVISYLAINSMLPTTFMIAQGTSTPKLSDSIGYLGHVTYTVKDPSGNIISYVQTDNSRTIVGQLCGLNALFQPAVASPSAGGGNTTKCDLGRVSQFTGYNVVGLINGSGTVTLNGSDTYTTSKIGGTRAGTKEGIVTVGLTNQGSPALGTVAAGASYNAITITSPAFAFSQTTGMTIRGSVLLNSTSGTPSMFAENQVSPTVTVGSGDTLTVTWNVSLS